MEKGRHFLFSWRKAFMSERGPKSSTTRHVLHALSAHMDLNGKSCFPSVVRLASETALSRRSVMDHIRIAVREGWIKRNSRIFNDRRWKRSSYSAVIPKKAMKVVMERDRVKEGGHFNAQGGNSNTQGGDFIDNKVVTIRQLHRRFEPSLNVEQQPFALSVLANRTYQQAVGDIVKEALNIKI